MKSAIDNKEPTIQEKEIDSSKMNQITKSIIKIIDNDTKKLVKEEEKVDNQQNKKQIIPQIQQEYAPESIDQLLDLFNEKILSLIKIQNMQNN